jgi:hypothetical protein
MEYKHCEIHQKLNFTKKKANKTRVLVLNHPPYSYIRYAVSG